jgi:hypothetical protein
MHEAAAADAWVGRADLLARVEADLGAIQRGSGRVLLLAGEPGIGKTRAVAEAIAAARGFGLTPILVSCRREAPAFWPWVRVLRACDAALGPRGLAALIRDDATWLRVLVPDLCAGGASEPPISGDAGPDGRFALADAIARSVAKVADEAPLLVALDDLHEADGGTLLALSLVADALQATPLALLGTHRDAEIDADPERAAMLARVARRGERIALRGLAAAEVDALLRARGVASDPALAARVHARTGGNPLFVVELARELRAGHSDKELPEGVREVVRARLARLEAPIRSLLAVAALIGERFQPALLATASGTTPAEVVALLERAARERLVLPVDDALGTWRFPHELLRDAIAAQIDTDARAAIHLRIGEALAAEGPAEGDRLTALSHHFYACAAIGGAARAVDCARRAARQQRVRGALDETAAQLRRALAALAMAPECGVDRADLLIEIGEAEAAVGRVEASRSALREAAAIARASGRVESLARAALAWPISAASLAFPGHYLDPDGTALVEEALAALPPGDGALRARLLAAIASAHAERDRVAADALAMARRCANADALAAALVARHWALWEPAHTEKRLALAEELVALADRRGDVVSALRGEAAQIADLLELGDRAGLDRVAHAFESRLARVAIPRFVFMRESLAALLAFLDGRLDASERRAAAALAIGRAAEIPEASALFGAQLLLVRREQGRIGELLPAFERANRGAATGLASVAHAYALAEAGQLEDARPLFERIVDAADEVAPGDSSRAAQLAMLAEVCTALEDAKRSRVLAARLDPYAERHLVVAGALSFGAAARMLAKLAVVARSAAEPGALFEAAIARNDALRAVPWSAHARADYARWLARSAEARDRSRAATLRGEAQSSAARAGLAVVLERLAPVARVAARADTEEAIFRRDGDQWTLRFGGRSASVRDLVGLRLLRRLIADPGVGVHVADLMNAAVIAGDAGVSLDAATRASYRERLAVLNAELAAAERRDDRGQSERLRSEADAIRSALAAAFGLGGRARPSNDLHERIRKAAYRRIQLALHRIDSAHPPLARHLRASLRTGSVCSYDPEQLVRWSVD